MPRHSGCEMRVMHLPLTGGCIRGGSHLTSDIKLCGKEQDLFGKRFICQLGFAREKV